MIKPFVADKCPKQYVLFDLEWNLNLENNIIGAHADCQRTNLSVMDLIQEPHTPQCLLLQIKKITTCACASKPRMPPIVTEHTIILTSDDHINTNSIYNSFSTIIQIIGESPSFLYQKINWISLSFPDAIFLLCYNIFFVNFPDMIMNLKTQDLILYWG